MILTRTLLVALLIATPTAAALLSPAPADDAEPPLVASLRHHQRIYWDGPFVERGGAGARETLDPLACEGEAASMWTCSVATVSPFAVGSTFCPDSAWCLEYAIEVREPAGTLRVALETHTSEDKFDLWIVPPGGVRAAPREAGVALGQAQGCGCYAMEARWPDAPAGTYVAQVLFYDVTDAPFRMRAYLEPPKAEEGAAKPLLPNLRMVPPFDLALEPCQASERLDFGAKRCLRFAAGPENVGDGPLDLRVASLGLGGPQVQRVHWSDGSHVDVPAGAYEYHAAHAHYHVRAMGSYELWKVQDAETGALALARQSPKVGFCMIDGLIAEWRSFRQDPYGSGQGTCGDTAGLSAPRPDPEDRPTFGLTRGWADIYERWTEGNFIDVAGLPDGLYVVRHIADPTGVVSETDETDNAAYALVQLEGDALDVLERGYGLSPWDPLKTLADDIRRPTAGDAS